MTKRTQIQTELAPAPGGRYSQAIACDRMVFLSGQLPLSPTTGKLVSGSIQDSYRQCFENLREVCHAAGGSLNDVVKLTIYFTDYAHAAAADEVIPEFFVAPYPARTRLTVSYLSKDSPIEIDAILMLPHGARPMCTAN